MGGRVEVIPVGGAGVEKPSGAKVEMPVVLGRFSGLERPKKKKREQITLKLKSSNAEYSFTCWWTDMMHYQSKKFGHVF